MQAVEDIEYECDAAVVVTEPFYRLIWNEPVEMCSSPSHDDRDNCIASRRSREGNEQEVVRGDQDESRHSSDKETENINQTHFSKGAHVLLSLLIQRGIRFHRYSHAWARASSKTRIQIPCFNRISRFIRPREDYEP